MQAAFVDLRPIALCAALLLTGHAAVAESTYGDGSPATAATTATKLRIKVNVPKLVVFRIGSAGALVDEIVINAQPSIPTSPSPVATTGNSQAANWTGAAPTFGSFATFIRAYLWHNSPGGVTLSCKVTTPFPIASGLTAEDITVNRFFSSLSHPGPTTACSAAAIALTRNSVLNGFWIYRINASRLGAAAAGSHTEMLTYTASTL